MNLLVRRYYPVGSSGRYLFSVAYGDGKDGFSPRTTHLTCQNFDCFIDGGDFFIVS